MEALAANSGDAALTLASAEHLAEATAMYLQEGRAPEAVSVLQQAVQAYEEDSSVHGESPPSMLAGASIRLLLCAALSHGGCHDLAYSEAQAAAARVDEVWSKHLLLCCSDDDGQDADSVEELKLAAALRDVLAAPPEWLVRGVELAVQARQCAATELEFMKDWELLEEDASVLAAPSGASSAEAAEEDVSRPTSASKSLYERLWRQIAQLHTEAVQLASQLLKEGHPVRASAERTLEMWLARGPEQSRDGEPFVAQHSPASARRLNLPARVATPVLAGMLAGQSGPSDEIPDTEGAPAREDFAHTWPSLAPASMSLPNLWKRPKPPPMPKHERYFQGLPPLDTSPIRRKKAAFGSTFDNSSGSGTAPSSPQPQLSSSKSDNCLRGAAKKQILASPNCAVRRAPIFASTQGSGGKAGWALRTNKPKQGATGKRIDDPFSEFLLGAAGPKRTLGQMVMASPDYMSKVQKDLGEQSRLFKNFWLKDEVGSDALFEDRTRFTAEGIQIFDKSSRQYPKSPFVPPSPPRYSMPMDHLLDHYGVQCKGAEPKMQHLGDLLRISCDSLKRTEAKTRKSSAKAA